MSTNLREENEALRLELAGLKLALAQFPIGDDAKAAADGVVRQHLEWCREAAQRELRMAAAEFIAEVEAFDTQLAEETEALDAQERRLAELAERADEHKRQRVRQEASAIMNRATMGCSRARARIAEAVKNQKARKEGMRGPEIVASEVEVETKPETTRDVIRERIRQCVNVGRTGDGQVFIVFRAPDESTPGTIIARIAEGERENDKVHEAREAAIERLTDTYQTVQSDLDGVTKQTFEDWIALQRVSPSSPEYSLAESAFNAALRWGGWPLPADEE